MSISVPALGQAPVHAHEHGIVTGRPLVWLRVEGASIAAAGAAAFATTGLPWWWIPVLFLVPDLSAAGYLVNRRVGAWTYNLAHTTTVPLILLGTGSAASSTFLVVAGAVGLVHIGIDRIGRYGVKYDHDPSVTHLGLHVPRPSQA